MSIFIEKRRTGHSRYLKNEFEALGLKTIILKGTGDKKYLCLQNFFFNAEVYDHLVFWRNNPAAGAL